MTPQTTKLIVVSAALTLLAGTPLRAQAPAADTLQALLAAHRDVVLLGRSRGDDVWPGYRPDTIPVAFVLPGRGTLLFGWTGQPPAGFASMASAPPVLWQPEAARGAASTSAELGGRAVAQVVVRSLARTELAGVAAHEAFHAFERAAIVDGRRFGRGENSFWVSQYPVFDVENEADMALEGRLLGAALRARSEAAARRLARAFVAVRRERHRRMGTELAEFEAMSELNEGLAQYALVRATSAADEVALLDSLTAASSLSVRRRYYTTGSTQALLLDRLTGAAWKTRLMAENLTLQDALGRATGLDGAAEELRADAARQFDRAGLRAAAELGVNALRSRRRRQADSLLARAGVQVVLDGGFGQCQFDPQNMLRVDSVAVLHTRWLVVCGGSAVRGEFNTPVLTDETRAIAVVGTEDEVRLTVAGAARSLAALTRLTGATDVQLESPGLTLRVARADIEREGRVLTIRPLR